MCQNRLAEERKQWRKDHRKCRLHCLLDSIQRFKVSLEGHQTHHILTLHFHLPTAYGFWAKPEKKQDGSLDLMIWTVGIPGIAHSK